MIPFSVLDLSPIVEGGDAAQALRNTIDLARHAEALGYRRYWLAEHHNMPGIASAATAVVIGQVAQATASIRVGAGGIMLPNHAPLVIAEQFGTLAALFPGRIDLGLGRAPGTDPVTSQALRRTLDGDAENFPQDVVELMGYFRAVEPGQRVRAVPGAGLAVPVWILGSSLYGAQLAAMLGLPFAFASHFAPQLLMDAIAIYRERFTPSAALAKPYVMCGLTVIAADSGEEARRLFISQQLAFISLRLGNPIPLPAPVDDVASRIDPRARGLLEDVTARTVVGDPAAVREGIMAFIRRTGADELMIPTPVFDHQARIHSYELVARIRDEA